MGSPVREVGVWQRISHFSSISATLWPAHRPDVYPFVPEILARLRMVGGGQVSIALGLISNTGNETASTLDDVLAQVGLVQPCRRQLCVFSSIEGLDKSQPSLLQRARERAALPAPCCVFVGEGTAEINGASVGFQVSATHFTLYTSLRPSYRPSTLSSHSRGCHRRRHLPAAATRVQSGGVFDLGATD